MTTDEEYEDLQRYAKLDPIVRRAADKYFANMFELQELWKQLVKEQSSSRQHKDQLWGLCQKGMELAWKWLDAEQMAIPGLTPPRNLPCYTRAIMLLEKEGRFGQAIVLCDQALHWTPNSEWYIKKKNSFLKKHPAPPEG
jgi:hypothetical protein